METPLNAMPLLNAEGDDVALGALCTGALRVLVFVRHFG